MELFSNYIQPLTSWLHSHPHWAGIITFIISFSESLAIIGSIVPGSVTMTAIGILIGSGVIPPTLIFTCAILGAVAGDSASYYIGYYYKDNLIRCWPFSKYPGWLTMGKKYFDKHGGKSVLLGRFIGPLRSIIPIIAGMMNMPNTRFLLANVVSAIGWSFLYISPGVFIGAASTELSAETATRLFVILLALLFGLWLAALLFKWIIYKTGTYIDKSIRKYWHKLANFPQHPAATFPGLFEGASASSRGRFPGQAGEGSSSKSKEEDIENWPPINKLLKLLFNDKDPLDHSRFAMLIIAALLLTSFILLTSFYFTTTAISLNLALSHFMHSMRTPSFDKLFIAIKLMGSPALILILTTAITLYFTSQRQFRLILIWTINALPGFILLTITPSYPDPIALLLSCLGNLLIGCMVQEKNSSTRNGYYLIYTTYLILVCFSRFYLGDTTVMAVIGGALLGFSISLINLIFIKKYVEKLPSSKPVVILCSSTTLLCWLLLMLTFFNQDTQKHRLQYPEHLITLNQWWQSDKPLLPVFRNNRFGHPVALLNIQFFGDKIQLANLLIKNGWQKPNFDSPLSFIERVAAKNKLKQLPVFPQLLNNKPPELTLYKTTPNKPIIILRLWKSNYQIKDLQHSLWIGSLHYRLIYQKHWHPFKKAKLLKTHQTPIESISILKEAYTIKTISLPEEQALELPHFMGKNILLIKPQDTRTSKKN